MLESLYRLPLRHARKSKGGQALRRGFEGLREGKGWSKQEDEVYEGTTYGAGRSLEDDVVRRKHPGHKQVTTINTTHPDHLTETFIEDQVSLPSNIPASATIILYRHRRQTNIALTVSFAAARDSVKRNRSKDLAKTTTNNTDLCNLKIGNT